MRIRLTATSLLLPSCMMIVLLLLLLSSNLVKAENNHKLRRGSVQQNDEIDDMSSLPTAEENDGIQQPIRSLLITDIDAIKKIPPYPLSNSKCGLWLRKKHPGCTRFFQPVDDPPSTTPQPTPSPTVFDLLLPAPPTTTTTTTILPTTTITPNPPPPPMTTTAPSSTAPTDRPLNCVQTIHGTELIIENSARFYKGDVHCLSLLSTRPDGGGPQEEDEAYFGYTWTNQFGLFVNGQSVWEIPSFPQTLSNVFRWTFQGDGNLVMRAENDQVLWMTGTCCYSGSQLKVSMERVWIESKEGSQLWSEPFSVTMGPSPLPTLSPTVPPTPSPTLSPTIAPPPSLPPTPSPTRSPTLPPTQPPNDNPDPHSGLQYFAYYYPWYLRDNWDRHGYQDEPLLGKYGTNEVAVAEQHIEWALETGISTWIISWWGPTSLAMRHFKEGMMKAPSLHKMKFCMLYETTILDDYGSWRDGSKEEALYQHLRVIVDEFFDHPSYLMLNGRPVIIFYITRSRMPYEEGFDGPKVLANMRRRLGHSIYFIADEPFFDWDNKSPSGNGNAFEDGQQVFDAYTTYNMFQNSRVRQGETATDYQLREAMPVWKQWAEQLPLFPNVMPQYYDFRGNKPLLGSSSDFMKQLREVACLPRTNFNGAPHIMMITSFNEWWEGTQIEPENGSRDNWNNYGFQFMETLAEFKKEMDSKGTYWCS